MRGTPPGEHAWRTRVDEKFGEKFRVHKEVSNSKGAEISDTRAPRRAKKQRLAERSRSWRRMDETTVFLLGVMVCLAPRASTIYRLPLKAIFFDQNADALYADIPDDNLIKQTLVFRSDPDLKRIVFIAVPYRGSGLALGLVGLLGKGLIMVPRNVAVTGIARELAGPASLCLPQWLSYRTLDR